MGISSGRQSLTSVMISSSGSSRTSTADAAGDATDLRGRPGFLGGGTEIASGFPPKELLRLTCMAAILMGGGGIAQHTL